MVDHRMIGIAEKIVRETRSSIPAPMHGFIFTLQRLLTPDERQVLEDNRSKHGEDRVRIWLEGLLITEQRRRDMEDCIEGITTAGRQDTVRL